MSLVHAYAKVIQEAESRNESRSFFDTLIAFMKDRGHLSLLREIVRVLEREPREPQATITLARESDVSKLKNTFAKDLAHLHVEKGESVISIDPDMVGGYRVKAGNTLVDRSFRSALVSIYQRTTHNG